MAYRIEYYSKGKIIGARVSLSSLEESKKAALEEVVRHGADFVCLIPLEGIPQQIWSAKREGLKSLPDASLA